MRVKVNVSRWGISTQLRQNADRAERALAVQMAADMKPYVPFPSATTVTDNRIVYPEPYAGVNYRGYLLVDPETKSPYARAGVRKVRGTTKNRPDGRLKYKKPGAGAYWLSKAKKVKIGAWQQLVAKEVTRGLDGK